MRRSGLPVVSWSMVSRLLLVAAALVGTPTLARAQSPILSVESQQFSFSGDTTIRVSIKLADAEAVAGLDFVLEYDADLLATEGELSAHVDPGLFGLLEVNHDFAFDSDTGHRQIKVAAANAQELGQLGLDGGTVVEIDFPVTCLGYAQAYPDGREVPLDLLDVHFFYKEGFPIELGNVVDGVLTLDCTSVTNIEQSLSTLKALYRR